MPLPHLSHAGCAVGVVAGLAGRPPATAAAGAWRPRAPRPVVALWLIGAIALPATSTAAVIDVGPGRAHATFASAVRAAADGDTIRLAAGTYRGDVAVIPAMRLTVEGEGSVPVVFDADGRHAEGKAIWVMRGGELTVRNVAFRHARVAGRNGAGIRQESGKLTVERCEFTDNQMGILTSNDGHIELVVDRSRFADAAAPVGDEVPHLLYAGRIARLTVRGSRFSGGHRGHLIKTRAAVTIVEDSVVDDGADGRASYEIDLSEGGAVRLERNTIGQSPQTENPVMVSFAPEGTRWTRHELVMRGNTFIDRRADAGTFVRIWHDRLPSPPAVRSSGERLFGAGAWQLGPQAIVEDVQLGPLSAAPAPAR